MQIILVVFGAREGRQVSFLLPVISASICCCGKHLNGAYGVLHTSEEYEWRAFSSRSARSSTSVASLTDLSAKSR